MVAISDYTTLVTAISATAEDDGAEFTDYIPTAIGLAHDTLLREMDLPDLEKKVNGSMTFQYNRIDKPDDYRFADYLFITVNNKKKLLRFRQNDFIVDYWPDDSQIDVPKYYSDFSATEILLAPTPDLSYTYELKYTGFIDQVSDTVPTNYFTDYCPHILFYAVMTEMSRFMKAWSQVQFWQSEFTKARDTWNIEMGRKRRDSGEVPNSGSGPNTLKHTIQTAS